MSCHDSTKANLIFLLKFLARFIRSYSWFRTHTHAVLFSLARLAYFLACFDIPNNKKLSNFISNSFRILSFIYFFRLPSFIKTLPGFHVCDEIFCRLLNRKWQIHSTSGSDGPFPKMNLKLQQISDFQRSHLVEKQKMVSSRGRENLKTIAWPRLNRSFSTEFGAFSFTFWSSERLLSLWFDWISINSHIPLIP